MKVSSDKQQRSANNMVLKTLLMLAVFGVYLPTLHAAPVTVDLTQFSSGDAGGRFIGPASSNTGTSLSQAGDHNGDGFNDFVFSSALLAKAVIVMKGNSTYSELDIANIVSDQYFRVITGPTGSNLGSCVGGIGDINGDGFDDVLIGARTAEVSGRGSAGFAFAVFGMKGPFTDIAVAADWIASTIGFVLLGPSSTSLFVGINQSGRGLGDVNDDGVDDFALSARWYPGTTGRNNAGTVFVIFGKTTPAFTNIDLLLVPDNFGSSHGVYFTGSAISDNFGIAVRPAGDFNGDGIADFLIGATGFDPPAVNSVARANAGAVYLVHGSATNLVNTDMLNFVTGNRGVRFFGAAAADATGNDHGYVGDINGDGVDDIAIGAPYADSLSRNNAGAVYVIYGTTTVFNADVDLLSFVTSSSFGFAIYGRAMDMLLSTIAPAGDINRDGANDILLGGGGGTSRAHLILGQTTARTTPVDTLTDDVLTFYLTDGAFLGLSLDGGDFNGDGNPDILLSGFRAAVTPESNTSATLSGAGAVWMISGLSLFPSPTANPSAAPSIVPSILPSAMPSFQPSIQPSLQPSIQPSVAPSKTDPTIDPTLAPSANPSFAPSEQPSVVPSVGPSPQPSQEPSIAPSASPSFAPSAPPSLSPSQVPTAQPSLDQTLAPTVDPSVTPSTQPSPTPSLSPSTAPSAVPSMDPSATPSAAPTRAPTAGPTINPTNQPTAAPTIAPSLVPTARPTSEPYQVVLVVEQVLYNATKADYDAQQAAFNLTIQHTVADATDGVIPERVTDIVVEEEEEEDGGRAGYLRALAATDNRVTLRYQVVVFDPLLTFEVLSAQLKAKVASKEFDETFRRNALLFNATRMLSGSFGEPRVTHLNPDTSDNDSETNNIGLIVGVVVGGVVFLILLVVGVFLYRKRKSNSATVVVSN